MYNRVIPRDLFNEANLLKCFGQLYLCLEIMNNPNVELEHEGDAFDIDQDADSGGLYLRNVRLIVRGEPMNLWRLLNSRGAYPLYLTLPGDEEIEVFSSTGILSEEMLAFLNKGEAPCGLSK